MKKVVLYSSSRAGVRPVVTPHAKAPGAKAAEDPADSVHARVADAAHEQSAHPPPQVQPDPPSARRPWAWFGRHQRLSYAVLGALVGLALALGVALNRPLPQRLTQKDIDNAVLHTLSTRTLPSPAAKAYDKIRPSVVRVRALGEPDEYGNQEEVATGSGVVILDSGVILTNVHVALSAPHLKVVFFDGHESIADVTGTRLEDDLAVIKARSVPDDLIPATMRSTGDLAVGDQVMAVGFPFGIGPSASAGIVSGLRREFRAPEGQRLLSNLIQFDAAANPGSSGGPLVTMEGEVVGIVTAILNPTEQRVFIGIGFAVPIENAAAAVGMSPF